MAITGKQVVLTSSGLVMFAVIKFKALFAVLESKFAKRFEVVKPGDLFKEKFVVTTIRIFPQAKPESKYQNSAWTKLVLPPTYLEALAIAITAITFVGASFLHFTTGFSHY